MEWEEYQKKLTEYGIDKKDFDDIEKAFIFASDAHEGQVRFSGDAYITHPINVSLKIALLKLDTRTIIAALLHDTVEDEKTTLRIIRKKFGEEVAFLVNGLTKVKKIKYRGVERQIESMRKMFLAWAEDVRVVIIKLMDRLHNMETLDSHPKQEKRERIALETLEIYAPLADRLGMWSVKSQLEDLSFKYVYPEEYKWLIDEVHTKIPDREKYLELLRPIVARELDKEGISSIEISWRAKNYYSLWKKLLKKDMDWSRILDLTAVRIIVKDVEACYATLGVIHKVWRPLPGRIKDYIALPKPNGYQSLHTTVFCEDGRVTEFQIRTPHMNRDAEFGIAAHWAWEMAGKPKDGARFQHGKFAWVKQLQEWQKEFKKTKQSGAEFLETLKIDFFKNRIFVLTPKGDVIDLPEGATPVDFAYTVHSEIGECTSGAKINGKMSALSHSLKSGDVVEILTQKNKKPSEEWLKFVKTSIARSRIKGSLRKSSHSLYSLGVKKPQKVDIIITAGNRVGLLKDVISVFESFRLNIEKITSDSSGIDYPIINISFTPKNDGQVEKIKTRLKNLVRVEEVTIKEKSR